MQYYSDASEVAALVPRYVDENGNFTEVTRPTQQDVLVWLRQVSAVIDSVLAKRGFNIPLEDPSARDAISLFVAEEVASLVEGVNNSGRFGPSGKMASGVGRFNVILQEAQDFIAAHVEGFQNMGARREHAVLLHVGMKDTVDNAPVTAIFTRENFGSGH